MKSVSLMVRESLGQIEQDCVNLATEIVRLMPENVADTVFGQQAISVSRNGATADFVDGEVTVTDQDGDQCRWYNTEYEGKETLTVRATNEINDFIRNIHGQKDRQITRLHEQIKTCEGRIAREEEAIRQHAATIAKARADKDLFPLL